MFKLVKNKNYKKYVMCRVLSKKLAKKKNNIDDFQNKWNFVKKLTNPYELIYINSYNSISKYLPISRSYFKMWEILCKFDLLNKNNHIACLAEGPGGFVEAINNYCKKNKMNVNIYGITLYSEHKGIPSWNNYKNKMSDKNVRVMYGNLYKVQDIMNYYKMFFTFKKANLVTADGGIDYSSDYNKQEQMSYQIIYGEIVTSLLILEKGGNFVCKIFDMFTLFTMKLLYLIGYYFEDFTLYKPYTSRVLNSEKYLIAKGFKGINKNDLSNLLNLLNNFDDDVVDIENIKITNKFFHNISEYNEKFGNQQLKYLDQALEYAKNNITEYEKKNIIEKQVKNALQWCTEYEVPINIKSNYLPSLPSTNSS